MGEISGRPAGRIVESGMHALALAADGLYRRLWTLQNARSAVRARQGSGEEAAE